MMKDVFHLREFIEKNVETIRNIKLDDFDWVKISHLTHILLPCNRFTLKMQTIQYTTTEFYKDYIIMTES